jgi:hypothetical protein
MGHDGGGKLQGKAGHLDQGRTELEDALRSTLSHGMHAEAAARCAGLGPEVWRLVYCNVWYVPA